jgi:hypothetical protein
MKATDIMNTYAVHDEFLRALSSFLMSLLIEA